MHLQISHNKIKVIGKQTDHTMLYTTYLPQIYIRQTNQNLHSRRKMNRVEAKIICIDQMQRSQIERDIEGRYDLDITIQSL